MVRKKPIINKGKVLVILLNFLQFNNLCIPSPKAKVLTKYLPLLIKMGMEYFLQKKYIKNWTNLNFKSQL